MNRLVLLLREIKAEIINLEYEYIPDFYPTKLIVKGEVAKEIYYVTDTGIVRKQDALLPFSVSVEISNLTLAENLSVTGQIEHLSHRLINNNTQVEQQILVLIFVSPVTNEDKSNNQYINYFLLTNIDTLDYSDEQLPRSTPPLESEIIEIPHISLLIEEKIKYLENDLLESLHSEIKEQIDAEIKKLQLNSQQNETMNNQQKNPINDNSQFDSRSKKYLEYQRHSAFQKIHGFKTKG